jgi:hypothetical protein
MTLTEFIDTVPSFHTMSGVDRITHLGWFLHSALGRESFSATELRNCFKEIHVEAPDLSVYLRRMAEKKPPQLIKDKGGYRLEGRVRRSLEAKFGHHPAKRAVSRLLQDLPNRLGSVPERVFLQETIDCYRVNAYRATIVMAWNLAFNHLRSWILADVDRLAHFNAAVVTRYPKKAIPVEKLDDFQELTEAEVVEVCRTGRLLAKDVVEVLREKLKRRNSAAHPSIVSFTQAQADDAITDLVNNVILLLR